MLPWPDWREQALDQTCISESAGLHKASYWVWCTTLTTYASFTGDLAAEIVRAEEIAEAASYHNVGPNTTGSAVHNTRAPGGRKPVGPAETSGLGRIVIELTWLRYGGGPVAGCRRHRGRVQVGGAEDQRSAAMDVVAERRVEAAR